jgi:hypothetical protein
MNQILGITLKLLRSRRFSALVALVAVGLLFTAAGANAGGCAVPYKTGAAPAIPFVSPHADGDSKEHATIVGLWHVLYTATYDNNFPPGGPYPPTPFPFLESFKTWHADGTEFENAFLPPAGGNICTVDETDTVASDGKTYKGMFDFKLWPPSYDAVGVGTPIAEVKGTTAATRIIVD